MKLISRLDLANPLHLTLEDGTTPPSLLKGSVVLLSEHQLDLVKSFGNVLVPLNSEAGIRAKVESNFEREKATKVAALLKKMGAKNLADARNTEMSGFLNVEEKTRPDLVALMELLRQNPPPPPRPSFVKELFRAKH